MSDDKRWMQDDFYKPQGCYYEGVENIEDIGEGLWWRGTQSICSPKELLQATQTGDVEKLNSITEVARERLDVAKKRADMLVTAYLVFYDLLKAQLLAERVIELCEVEWREAAPDAIELGSLREDLHTEAVKEHRSCERTSTVPNVAELVSIKEEWEGLFDKAVKERKIREGTSTHQRETNT